MEFQFPTVGNLPFPFPLPGMDYQSWDGIKNMNELSKRAYIWVSVVYVVSVVYEFYSF